MESELIKNILEQDPNSDIESIIKSRKFGPELINRSFLTDLDSKTLDELFIAIDTANFLLVNSANISGILDQIFWIIGESNEIFNNYFTNIDSNIWEIKTNKFPYNVENELVKKFGSKKINLNNHHIPLRFIKYKYANGFHSLKLLKWLKINVPTCLFTLDTSINAAWTGDLEKCKWLHSINCPFDGEAFDRGAQSGNIEIVEFLSSIGCYGVETAYTHAGVNGHIHMLEWLKSHGVEYNTEDTKDEPIYEAIGSNQLKAVKWFVANGFANDKPFILAYATLADNLDIFKYLVQLRWEVKSNIMNQAIKYGKLDRCKELYSMGYLPGPDAITIATKSKKSKNAKLVEWIESINKN